MSEEMWKKYDEISDRAFIMIGKGKNGKFYIVDRDTDIHIAGPFESSEAAAISLIEGDKNGRGSEEKADGRNRVAVH